MAVMLLVQYTLDQHWLALQWEGLIVIVVNLFLRGISGEAIALAVGIRKEANAGNKAARVQITGLPSLWTTTRRTTSSSGRGRHSTCSPDNSIQPKYRIH